MICFGNAVSSHSGLIPLKTAYEKRGEYCSGRSRVRIILLTNTELTNKKNFINSLRLFVLFFLICKVRCSTGTRNCNITATCRMRESFFSRVVYYGPNRDAGDNPCEIPLDCIPTVYLIAAIRRRKSGESLECILLDVYMNNKRIAILCVYKPPSVDNATFSKELSAMLDEALSFSDTVICTGDQILIYSIL